MKDWKGEKEGKDVWRHDAMRSPAERKELPSSSALQLYSRWPGGRQDADHVRVLCLADAESA